MEALSGSAYAKTTDDKKLNIDPKVVDASAKVVTGAANVLVAVGKTINPKLHFDKKSKETYEKGVKSTADVLLGFDQTAVNAKTNFDKKVGEIAGNAVVGAANILVNVGKTIDPKSNAQSKETYERIVSNTANAVLEFGKKMVDAKINFDKEVGNVAAGVITGAANALADVGKTLQ